MARPPTSLGQVQAMETQALTNNRTEDNPINRKSKSRESDEDSDYETMTLRNLAILSVYKMHKFSKFVYFSSINDSRRHNCIVPTPTHH